MLPRRTRPAPRAAKRRGPLNRPHCMCAVYGSRPRPPRLLRLVPPDRQAGHTAWAPRPVRWRPRLNASGQLLIPGRRSEPGVFPRHLRVPPVRPAKHHPHHYRRGKPSGQADQHPPPQAHPNPKRHIPKSRTRAVPSTHHTTSHASALRPSPLSPSPLWRNHAHGSWATSPAAISAFLKLLVWLTSPHLHHAAITHPHQTWD
jgi:hypothetical protein